MWWGQAPLLDALERPALDPLPGQLVHPLLLQLDAPPPPPAPAAEGARWTLEQVRLELDGEPLADVAAPAPGDPPLWQGELTPGAHTLLALFTYRREGASDDDLSARVRVERPQIIQARPGRPLALDLPRAP
jgi:hypothetical protein